MIKNVSLRWLKKHGACNDAIKSFAKQEDHDLISTLKRIVKKDVNWSLWLLECVLPKKLRVKYADEDCGTDKQCREVDRKYIKILENLRKD